MRVFSHASSPILNHKNREAWIVTPRVIHRNLHTTHYLSVAVVASSARKSLAHTCCVRTLSSGTAARLVELVRAAIRGEYIIMQAYVMALSLLAILTIGYLYAGGGACLAILCASGSFSCPRCRASGIEIISVRQPRAREIVNSGLNAFLR